MGNDPWAGEKVSDMRTSNPGSRGASMLVQRAPSARRRLIATGGLSAAFHAALIWLLLSHVPQSRFAGGAGNVGGGGEGGAVVITIVGRHGRGSAATESQASRSTPLESMAETLRTESTTVSPNRLNTPLDQMMAPAQNSSSTSNERPPAGGSAGASRLDQQEAQMAGAERNEVTGTQGRGATRGQKSRASGDMWGQVSNCWQPTQRLTSSVVLEVTVDDNGQVAMPPRILRPGETPRDSIRFDAEAQAVRAVFACAPYSPAAPRNQRKTYRISFAGD